MKNDWKNEKVREFLKYNRLLKKMSQKEMAEFLEISQQDYSRYEVGKVMIPAWVLMEIYTKRYQQ